MPQFFYWEEEKMRKKEKGITLLNKFVIILLVISLTITNFLVVGETLVSYATELVLDNQTATTINENVEFDTYFKLDDGDTHYLVCDVNEQNSNMTLDLKIQKGYLKDAKIELQNPNYSIVNVMDTMEKVQEATYNEISLKQINANESVEIGLTIMQNIENEMKLEDISKDSIVVLKAIYVDEKGNEIEIEKNVTINISWTGNYEAEINSELVKNVEFTENEAEKVLVQVLVQTGIKETENKLPIKENNIEISVPSLNGAKPENVKILTKTTLGTNGQTENIDLPEENVEKDLENNIIKIKIENEETDGKVWTGNGRDELFVTYIYNKADMTEESSIISSKISTETEMYDGNTIKQELTSEFDVSELKGSLNSLELLSNLTEINKGKMYANSVVTNKQYETEINATILAEIAYKENVTGISVEDIETYFTDTNNNKYTVDNAYYKNISINKANFEKILGQDGEIKISYDGNVVAVINNTLEANEDGNYLIKLTNKYNNLAIEMSAPVSEGILYINIQKAIDGELEYSKTQIMSFNSLITKMQLEQITQTEGVSEILENKEMALPLTETYTNANISINPNTLSTKLINEDVEVKIELDNARENSDLYVNGTFKIEFPEYIEDIEVKSYNILYSEGLVIKEIAQQKENNKMVLNITLDGTQANFSTGTVTNGTNIILGMNIKAGLLTPMTDDEIELYYKNDNAVLYNTIDEATGLGFNKANVSFITPVGMLAVNKISGYEETGKSVISVNQGTVVDKIQMDSDAKNAKMDLMVINNTGDNCTDVKVLGRIPFENNKKIGTDEELKTTVNTTMSQAITIEGETQNYAKIYYSENGEATEDLNNANNMWTQTVEDFSNVKSYMIIFENYELKQGEVINMSYDFIIPEMIDLNNSLYGTFGIFYNRNSEIGIIAENTIADIVGLTTGTGPVMEINQSVSVGEDGVIQEGQEVKYTFSIKNAGNNDIEDLKIKDLLPDYATYGEYKGPEGMGPDENTFTEIETAIDEETGKSYVEFNIGTLKPGETVEKELIMKFGKLPTVPEYYENEEGFYYDSETGKSYIIKDNGDGTYTETELTSIPEIKVLNILKITAKDLELKTVKGNENKIEKVALILSEKSNKAEDIFLRENEELIYTVSVENSAERDMNNVVVQKILPDGLDFSKIYIETYNEEKEEFEVSTEGTYDSSTRRVSITIPTLASGDIIDVIIKTVTSKLEDNVYEKVITTNSEVYEVETTKYKTVEVKNEIAKPKLTVKQSDNTEGEYILEGEQIIFKCEIKNEGKISSGDVMIINLLNPYFEPSSITYYTNEGEKSSMSTSTNNLFLEKIIEAGQTLTMEITATASTIPSEQKEMSIENVFTVVGETIVVESNTITKTIEKSDDSINTDTNPTIPDDSSNSNNSSTPNEIKTYKIKGTAWLDANSNGAREDTEKLFAGIKVILINAKTGDIITDRTTGKAKETVTNENGAYEFDNLIQGEYLVVFYHDSSIYGLTEYKKAGIDNNINSDVILTKLIDNGEEKTVAVTDTIVIETKSVANIDIGLVANKKVDLKLDKYISTLTIQNKDGVKAYNYTETTLAKIDISAKRMEGTVVVAEYAIVVTNEGNMPAYAKNIVDYMPQDMKFNSDLNPNWYAGNDGNLYSTELANTVINPGESKTVNLILTKTMTENNAGVSNNRAEIYEEYNELGIPDIDSTPANQKQGEDDLGTANIAISTKTGAEVTYTCTILIALVILVTGVYFIRKKTSRYYN